MKKQKSSENVNTNKGLKTKGGGGGESLDVDEELFSLVSTVVQWYLVLEEVGPLPPLSPDINNLLFSQIASDRASESYFQSSRAKCQCDKAKEIIQKCSELQRRLEQVVQVGLLRTERALSILF